MVGSRSRSGARLLGALLGWAAAATAQLGEPAFPAPRGRITDLAGVLAPAARARLERGLDRLRAAGIPTVVAVVDDPRPWTMREFAVKALRQWRVGGGERDDGLVILVAARPSTILLEPGYDLEPLLRPRDWKRLLDGEVGTLFRTEGIGSGLPAFVEKLADRVETPGWMDPSVSRRLGTSGRHGWHSTGEMLADLLGLCDALPLVLLVAWLRWGGHDRERAGPPSGAFVPVGLGLLGFSALTVVLPTAYGWPPWGIELILALLGPPLFLYGAAIWCLDRFGTTRVLCPRCRAYYQVFCVSEVRPAGPGRQGLREVQAMCRSCDWTEVRREPVPALPVGREG